MELLTETPPVAAMPRLDTDRLQQVADTIRVLAMDAVEAAASGHPGMPMGMADAATVLWTRHLKHNPRDPQWPDRDRFVLSAGHGSMLLYALLHLTSYDLSLDDLKTFRQWGSKTPGHPEYGHTPGVETTTGPLGQGFANAVGMALAERWLAERYNRPDLAVVDHHTYVIAGDGDLMEGISHEAASLAGHLGLGKLIVLYDDNGISIDGPTDLAFTEDVLARFEAYGWHTQRIDGHDAEKVDAALWAAKAETQHPSIIACRTVIGQGSPSKAGTAATHGSPLGREEVQRAKMELGWPADETFYIPEAVQAFMRTAAAEGRQHQTRWAKRLDAYEEAFPQKAGEFNAVLRGDVPENLDAMLPVFEPGTSEATRASSGKVIGAIADAIPQFVGGSADLTGSNKTQPGGEAYLTAEDFAGRYIHFGVREHAMGAILNGMALHGGMIPYGGTFLVFSDYMRPAVRMAALMNQRVIYVFTHDSIGLGEDGPTHQPIEHLSSLRAIPNLVTIRPADANETAEAWLAALRRTDGPTALVLTRQTVPTLTRGETGCAASKPLFCGGYILRGFNQPDVILMASGSEVHLALAAADLLAQEGTEARVVSMPSTDIFDAQSTAYRAFILPETVRARVAVEAGATLGWHKYVGDYGHVVGLDRFGASAPYEVLYDKLGLTPEAVAEAARRSMAMAPR